MNQLNRVLVTGGAGYIGSHTTLLLLQAGFDVVVLDNLCNSSAKALRRVAQLAGRSPVFVQGDIRDTGLLNQLLADYPVQAVFHFAGLKAVGESVAQPLDYCSNNVGGTLMLCQAMAAAGVYSLIFSSSATVYGTPSTVPITEEFPVGQTTNPYGRSKFIVEQMLADLVASDSRWHIALLRYFNPVGAHESGNIGEDPLGVPYNLFPYITQVAAGKRQELVVFGNDYPTVDDTGVRDYIHVMDLAEGHLAALNALQNRNGIHIWNLGTGQGYSVLQIIQAIQVVSGRSVPYRIAPRRAGDIATCYANPAKAEHDLCWIARRDLQTMIFDAWRWQMKNPDGYGSSFSGRY
ncbi:MAG: UDP-glucose 4-epimerase GalE [Pseudomonadota bacterium]|jgi:UDP-glucose 4-epimerase